MGSCNNLLGARSQFLRFAIVLACMAVAYFGINQYVDIHHKASPSSSRAVTTRNVSLKGLMTAHNMGRLGNQMGSYAALYALSQMNYYTAYVHPRMYRLLTPIFKIRLPLLPTSLRNFSLWSNFTGEDWMSEHYCNMMEPYIVLRGYYNSWTFFDHIRDEILDQFTFHDHLKVGATSTLNRMRQGRRNPTYIGVHVRRGDYVTLMPRRYHGVIADKVYLEKAFGYFRRRYQEPVFVVASDGLRWCHKNMNTSRGDIYFVDDWDESSPAKDLALLAHCNHTIMTIGTFGFWAAYLAGGEVVYLTNYTTPDSSWLTFFKPTANYLPEWIGMESATRPK